MTLTKFDQQKRKSYLQFEKYFFFPNSLSNLVMLILFNNHRIFYDNEKAILYNQDLKMTLVCLIIKNQLFPPTFKSLQFAS